MTDGAFVVFADLVVGAVAATCPYIAGGATPPAIAATNTRESPRIFLSFRFVKELPVWAQMTTHRFDAQMQRAENKGEHHFRASRGISSRLVSRVGSKTANRESEQWTTDDTPIPLKSVSHR
jgi:hypothetical protein